MSTRCSSRRSGRVVKTDVAVSACCAAVAIKRGSRRSEGGRSSEQAVVTQVAIKRGSRRSEVFFRTSVIQKVLGTKDGMVCQLHGRGAYTTVARTFRIGCPIPHAQWKDIPREGVRLPSWSSLFHERIWGHTGGYQRSDFFIGHRITYDCELLIPATAGDLGDDRVPIAGTSCLVDRLRRVRGPVPQRANARQRTIRAPRVIPTVRFDLALPPRVDGHGGQDTASARCRPALGRVRQWQAGACWCGGRGA